MDARTIDGLEVDWKAELKKIFYKTRLSQDIIYADSSYAYAQVAFF